MDEITLDDKTYVSSKRAAQITGYAKDYVGQLCREGRVDARLVGRNWYVLEDSIREHRFGAEHHVSSASEAVTEEKTAQNDENTEVSSASEPVTTAESAWKSPNYTPDPTPKLIPTLNSFEKRDEINVLDKYPSRDEFGNVISDAADSDVVKEMQSAWHDWFVRTNELSVSKEILLENTTDAPKNEEISTEKQKALDEMTSEDLARHRFDAFDSYAQASKAYSAPVVAVEKEEIVPISLERVSEVIQKGTEQSAESFGSEEIIPIHKTISNSAVPAQKLFNTHPTPPVYSRSEIRSDVFTRKDGQEGRIIRERRVMPKKKPSLVLQVFFLCIAGLAIVVTLIGSGMLESFINARHADYAPVQYLVGESTVVK